MKFTVYAKDLKSAIEKISSVVPKKASIVMFTDYHFMYQDGKVYLVSTDADQTLEVVLDAEVDTLFCTQNEVMSINSEDIKVLTKATDYVTLESVARGCQVTYGKRKVVIPANITEYGDIDCFLVDDTTSEYEVELEESYLYDTLTSLVTFVGTNESMRVMECINFNLTEGRLEALDGHRLAFRRFNSNTQGSFLLNRTAVPVMKKVLNKNGTEKISVSASKSYVYIKGKDFKYRQKQVEGQYYIVSRILSNDFNTICRADTKQLTEICKYIKDMADDTRKPLIFDMDESLTVRYANIRYTVKEEIESEIEGESLKIAFNPAFILDMLNLIKTDTTEMKFVNMKSPVTVDNEDWFFLTLPINFDENYYAKTQDVA